VGDALQARDLFLSLNLLYEIPRVIGCSIIATIRNARFTSLSSRINYASSGVGVSVEFAIQPSIVSVILKIHRRKRPAAIATGHLHHNIL